jgi:hypothetical protein
MKKPKTIKVSTFKARVAEYETTCMLSGIEWIGKIILIAILIMMHDTTRSYLFLAAPFIWIFFGGTNLHKPKLAIE